MEPAQAAKATAEGYMAGTLLHEIAHELGPEFARQNGRQVDINEAIGPPYAGLEEAKADVVTGRPPAFWAASHAAPASNTAGKPAIRTARFAIVVSNARSSITEAARAVLGAGFQQAERLPHPTPGSDRVGALPHRATQRSGG
ncbi:MAG: hypothetical protein LAQ69_39730 [Acidobacteriia bacterium]|nr:hypothetical protein [Terriglobia bacterium]